MVGVGGRGVTHPPTGDATDVLGRRPAQVGTRDDTGSWSWGFGVAGYPGICDRPSRNAVGQQYTHQYNERYTIVRLHHPTRRAVHLAGTRELQYARTSAVVAACAASTHAAELVAVRRRTGPPRQRASPNAQGTDVILAIMTIDRGALGRVVAIANGKGGVGKTSLTTTLAGLAATAGYRILLIDLDPQGNAGEDLGYTGAGTGDDGVGLVAALAADTPLAVTLPQARPGIDVICGGERLDDLAGLLLARHRRGTPVADVLAGPLAELLSQRDDYDLILIDCPPGEPNLQLLALGAARWLIVPTRGDAASLKGMTRIAQRLVEARDHNRQLELLGVVLFDIASSATRVKREISAEITQALGGVAPLFDNTIRHSIAATDSRRRGLLIHEHAAQLEGEPFWQALREGRRPSSPGSAPALAADYAALAHEILTRISALEAAIEAEEVMA